MILLCCPISFEKGKTRIVNEFVSMEGVEGAIAEFQHRRQGYYEGLKTFAAFGRGWTRRVTETTELALNMTET